MMWSDVVALALIAGVAWLESHRGFGRALFDLLGAIISVKVAAALAEPLGKAVPVFSAAGPNQAFWLTAAFVVLAVLTVIGSKLIYDTILLSLDVLDPLVGGLLGFASGLVVAHIFLKMMSLGYADSEAAKLLLSSFMGQELLQFRAYHTVVTALQNLGKW